MIAIGTFININDRYYFQNFYAGEVRDWEGQEYGFAGFGYGGSSSDLQGGNVESELVFNTNALSLDIAKRASDKRWIVTIKTVWLDPGTLEEDTSYMTDIFMVTGFNHDTLRLTLRLSSPLDAVNGDVPRRRLTERMVGALPSTGDIALL